MPSLEGKGKTPRGLLLTPRWESLAVLSNDKLEKELPGAKGLMARKLAGESVQVRWGHQNLDMDSRCG